MATKDISRLDDVLEASLRGEGFPQMKLSPHWCSIIRGGKAYWISLKKHSWDLFLAKCSMLSKRWGSLQRGLCPAKKLICMSFPPPMLPSNSSLGLGYKWFVLLIFICRHQEAFYSSCMPFFFVNQTKRTFHFFILALLKIV